MWQERIDFHYYLQAQMPVALELSYIPIWWGDLDFHQGPPGFLYPGALIAELSPHESANRNTYISICLNFSRPIHFFFRAIAPRYQTI